MNKGYKTYTKFERLLEQKSKADGIAYTIADVCRQTGIAESTMSMWKKRGGSLEAKNLSILADFFGVSASYFFAED